MLRDVVIDATGPTHPNRLGDGGSGVARPPSRAHRALSWRPSRASAARRDAPFAPAGPSGSPLRATGRFARDAPGTRVVWALGATTRLGAVRTTPLPIARPLTRRRPTGRGASASVSVHAGVVTEALVRGRRPYRRDSAQRRTERVVADTVLALTAAVGDASLYRQRMSTSATHFWPIAPAALLAPRGRLPRRPRRTAWRRSQPRSGFFSSAPIPTAQQPVPAARRLSAVTTLSEACSPAGTIPPPRTRRAGARAARGLCAALQPAGSSPSWSHPSAARTGPAARSRARAQSPLGGGRAAGGSCWPPAASRRSPPCRAGLAGGRPRP